MYIYGQNDLDHIIIVTSHIRHGVSNHREFNCSLDSSFGKATKKTQKPRITGHLRGETTGNLWIPFTKGR